MACNENTDPLKLVREGTSQDNRFFQALDPTYAPVNERTPAHGIVFAQAYAKYIRYFDSTNVSTGNWQPFFGSDISAKLAIAAIQQIEEYKLLVKSLLGYLNNLDNQNKDAELRQTLGQLFSIIATLAYQLDLLQETLPAEIQLKPVLQNLIRNHLSGNFGRLISYFKGGLSLNVIQNSIPVTTFQLLGSSIQSFEEVISKGLSGSWFLNASDWNAYYAAIAAETSVYGTSLPASVFKKVNHVATHNLFTSIFDEFLKVFARITTDAEAALNSTFTDWDRHEPHYALFLAFLRLQEHARTETNKLTGRHLDFYYREVLQLKEKPASPTQVHVLIELAKHVQTSLLNKNTSFKAIKDASGKDTYFINQSELVVNTAKVEQLKTVYRHKNTPTPEYLPSQTNRIFASPAAKSDDGLGAPLPAEDPSFHPFFRKAYTNGKLTAIKMPKAEIGFLIASHYLYLAEGERTITVDFPFQGTFELSSSTQKIECLLSSEKGWVSAKVTKFKTESGVLRLVLTLDGEQPPVTTYSAKIHGYTFAVQLPVLLVKLKQDTSSYLYNSLESLQITSVKIEVKVENLKSLALSNDFGPVDASKPFQPFGASPVSGNGITIGSRELFQKHLTSAVVYLNWQATPAPFSGSPQLSVDLLEKGVWKNSGSTQVNVTSGAVEIDNNLNMSSSDYPDDEINDFYQSGSRHGFAKIKLNSDFGQNEYQTQLLDFLRGVENVDNPGKPPSGPFLSSLEIAYEASQTINLISSSQTSFAQRKGRFYHLGPFGHAEQHYLLSHTATVPLVPQFEFVFDNATSPSEAEFYIGLSGLIAPQNLSLLFQIADGTADPLSKKPANHLHWSYLSANEWKAFKQNEIDDKTDGLLNSGIITFQIPKDISNANTLLPGSLHWIRVAVSETSAAVCSLLEVSAQAVLLTFQDKNNDPAFPSQVLPAGSISKLEIPVAAIKKITQPFSSFGGRGKESSEKFYTRISERLRHKDRSVNLWDYERLILEEFPQIYKAKCLNHTQYEPSDSGAGVYKELAPGHVTLITIPNQLFHNLKNPLQPYTSLGLLEDIRSYLDKHVSPFVKLHVKNPQFEKVSVDFKVKLYEGADESFSIKRLQEAITRFLSPWAFSADSNPDFGGKIYKSVLINFVEDQPYVDYVIDFKLKHSVTGNADHSEIEGSKAISILVSAPATEHLISAIHPEAETLVHEICPCEV